MKAYSDYMITTFKILFFSLAGIFFCDYVLSSGGFNTILSYNHSALLIIPKIVVIVAFIWTGFNAIVLATNHKWLKFGILIVMIALVLLGAKITVGILAEKSEKKAIKLISTFFSQKNGNFRVTIDDDVKDSYLAFLSSVDMSSVKLISSYPPHGRYNFLITGKSDKPFIATLWVEDSGGRILVTHAYM